MQTRYLGATGVPVSKLCLGAMMFGAWGNPGPRRVDPDHPPRAGRRYQLHRHRRRLLRRRVRGHRRQGAGRRPARRRVARHQGRVPDGRRPQPARRLAPAGSSAAVEDSLRRPADRLDRPLPDPPTRPAHRHRRDARRADRPRQRRQDPVLRALDVRAPPQIVEAQWAAARRGHCAVPLRAAALLDSHPRHRARRAAHLPAVRDGRDPLQPARRRLAVGPLPQGRGHPGTQLAARPQHRL